MEKRIKVSDLGNIDTVDRWRIKGYNDPTIDRDYYRMGKPRLELSFQNRISITAITFTEKGQRISLRRIFSGKLPNVSWVFYESRGYDDSDNFKVYRITTRFNHDGARTEYTEEEL